MVDSNGNNLVFLLCTPRSGSSLATVMLQNHSKMFATQEMWFLMSLVDLQSPQRRAYGGTGIYHQFFNGVLPHETFEDACRAFALQVYNGLLQSSAGAELVIDKSPRYYYLLEFLDALFPQSRRIWLIRNPFAVLASYKKVNKQRGGRLRFGGRPAQSGLRYENRRSDRRAVPVLSIISPKKTLTRIGCITKDWWRIPRRN